VSTLFRQVIHEDLGCGSYLVGDTRAGVAAVIDPQWDIDPYLRLSRLHGVRIEHVLETHNHADHVSGHGRLARATGATIHIHRLAEAEYDHESIDDGWTLRLGDRVEIEAIHTPGHRPEHTSFAVRDSGSGRLWAVLTGDSLFIGDVARPDLAVEPRDGAAEIYRSLHERQETLVVRSAGPTTSRVPPSPRSAPSADTTRRSAIPAPSRSSRHRSRPSGSAPRTSSTSSPSTGGR
jgi:hydroxyacylglutathione hydrolase